MNDDDDSAIRTVGYTDDDEVTIERRIDVRAPAQAICIACVNGEQVPYRLLDLSCGGALLERCGAAKPAEVHTVVLQLGNAEPIVAAARVVWSDEQRHAIRFVAMSDVDRIGLAEHIDQTLQWRAIDESFARMLDALDRRVA